MPIELMSVIKRAPTSRCPNAKDQQYCSLYFFSFATNTKIVKEVETAAIFTIFKLSRFLNLTSIKITIPRVSKLWKHQITQMGQCKTDLNPGIVS